MASISMSSARPRFSRAFLGSQKHRTFSIIGKACSVDRRITTAMSKSTPQATTSSVKSVSPPVNTALELYLDEVTMDDPGQPKEQQQKREQFELTGDPYWDEPIIFDWEELPKVLDAKLRVLGGKLVPDPEEFFQEEFPNPSLGQLRDPITGVMDQKVLQANLQYMMDSKFLRRRRQMYKDVRTLTLDSEGNWQLPRERDSTEQR